MPKRDEFSLETKELLAKRVGMKCSNPNCRQPTSGPASDPKKVVNIGVGAHITAASKDGPRYDASLSVEERKGPDNGIWCCQNCGKLVDSDQPLYTVDLLRYWKNSSEEAARRAIDSPSTKDPAEFSDEDLIRFYAQCFDRRAFRDPFIQEGSMPKFDKAIENTITAICTGCSRDEDGRTLAQSKGKVYLRNQDWRRQMDTIVDLLRAIRSRYELGIKLGLIWTDGNNHCINDRHTADWMDRTREEILRLFEQVANQAGVKAPHWPSSRHHRDHH